MQMKKHELVRQTERQSQKLGQPFRDGEEEKIERV